MKEFNIPVELSDLNKNKYAQFSEKINEILDNFKGKHKKFMLDERYIFKNDFDMIISAYRGTEVYHLGKYVKVSATKIRKMIAKILNENPKDKTSYWHSYNIENTVSLFFELTRKRNAILHNSFEKMKTVIEILKIRKHHTLIMTDSGDNAVTISDNINFTFRDGFKRDVSNALYPKLKSVHIYDDTLKDYVRYTSGPREGKIKNFGVKTVSKIIIDNLKRHNFQTVVTTRTVPKELTGNRFNTFIRISTSIETPLLYLTDNCIILNLFIDDETVTANKDVEILKKTLKQEGRRDSGAVFVNNIFNIFD